MKVKSESEVTQSRPTLRVPMDCSLPGSSIHGIFQARILEWVAISFSRGSSQPRDQTWVAFINWATKLYLWKCSCMVSVLAWRVPGTGEPGGLPSMGSHRVGHDWSDLAEGGVGLPWRLSGKESTCQCMRHRFNLWIQNIPWGRKWQPTSVFLPGKLHGQRSLAGNSPWGHKRVRHNWACLCVCIYIYIYIISYIYIYIIKDFNKHFWLRYRDDKMHSDAFI